MRHVVIPVLALVFLLLATALPSAALAEATGVAPASAGATLVLTGVPPGSELSVDGARVPLPPDGRLPLAPGHHVVSIRRQSPNPFIPGFEPVTLDVDLAPGEERTTDLALEVHLARMALMKRWGRESLARRPPSTSPWEWSVLRTPLPTLEQMDRATATPTTARDFRPRYRLLASAVESPAYPALACPLTQADVHPIEERFSFGLGRKDACRRLDAALAQLKAALASRH